MSLLDQFDCDRATLERILGDTLLGADDGELFIEATQSESLAYDDGKLKSASYDTRQGFGLRSVFGEASGYAHAGDLSQAALERAAQAVRAVGNGYSGKMSKPPRSTNTALYEAENPLIEPGFEAKARLLEEIDAYARGLGEDVHQGSVSLTGSWQNVAILRADGRLATDIRPLVRLSISAVCRRGDRQESGSHGLGGRHSFERIITPDVWKYAVDEAVRQARVNLDAVPAPAGTVDVVLGNGWPGVMLHEAVGLGVEGVFYR